MGISPRQAETVDELTYDSYECNPSRWRIEFNGDDVVISEMAGTNSAVFIPKYEFDMLADWYFEEQDDEDE